MWYAATAARSASRSWSRARAPRRRSAACGADAAMGATPQVDVPHVDVPHVDVAVVGGGIAGLWLLARLQARSEERRVGKSVSVRVDLGGRRIIKKKKYDLSTVMCRITYTKNI